MDALGSFRGLDMACLRVEGWMQATVVALRE